MTLSLQYLLQLEKLGFGSVWKLLHKHSFAQRLRPSGEVATNRAPTTRPIIASERNMYWRPPYEPIGYQIGNVTRLLPLHRQRDSAP